MQYRSWLIVAGDSEKKLGKAASTGADVVEQIPEPGYRSSGARAQERAVPVTGERPHLRVAR